MRLRSCLLLLCLASWSACADDPALGPDAGIKDAAVQMVVDAPAADATPDAPDAPSTSDTSTDTFDAPTDASDAATGGTSCGSTPPSGGCVFGREYGCCGDNASISRVCQGGAWVCPSGSISPATCCGILTSDGLCGRFSSHPQCDRLFGDAGVIRP